MKKCDYCGKANEDTLLFCAGCGTELKVPDEAQTESSSETDQKAQPRVLNAGSATIILLAFLAVQLFCGFLMGAIASGIASAQGIHNLHQIYLISDTLDPAGAVWSLVLGGIVMVLVSLTLAPRQLIDTSPCGAAWVLGPKDAIIKGLIIGLIIGMCEHAFMLISKHHVAYRDLDFLNRIALTPGYQRWVVIGMAVLLVPFTEEMLFRGILYGGYRKSFGPVWAAIITTFIFVVGHYSYYAHVPSNVISIIAGALVMLWCRLHWNAIGPAIAVHASYNFVLAFFFISRTWQHF